jgi:hypothetical protein
MEIDEPIDFKKGDKININDTEYTILSIKIETCDNGNITRYLALITPDTIENAECLVIQHTVDGITRLFIDSKLA